MGAGGSFDEMGLGAANVRPLYREIARWLEETPPEVLASRRAQAEFMFRRIGITFGVYGDKDAAERLIPFDIVPRLISRAEWSVFGGRAHSARQRAQPVPEGRLRPARDP